MPVVLRDRYELVREIASGAMGEVHEAIDRTNGQRVAVKMLRPELAAEAALRRRFRRESSILRSIEHPGIVRILDAGEDDDERAFTVMELLEGETLESRLQRDGAMSIETAAPMLLGVASALEEIHGRGVVHGDLKPANVFLTPSAPFAKLVDFGLSKVEGLDRLTRTGELAGTPVYMAPELFTGEGGREPDARLDLYALGVLAYQTLSNALPFDTRKHPGQLMFDVAMGKVVPLATRVPTLPEDVVAAIAHAMSPRREQRPPNASALVREWRDAFDRSR
ncbi:MAG: serine/threonine protein kinase [Deltaproteobacteria bacterium]|nr:serine/threonine protein kinase [Deltaproteobacteria bacterium]